MILVYGWWCVLDRKFQGSLEPKYPRVDTVEGGGGACHAKWALQGRASFGFVLHCIFSLSLSVFRTISPFFLLQANSTFV
jgi:hypothetical protein